MLKIVVHILLILGLINLNSRRKLIDFAEKHQITIMKDKRGEAPFSVDANLLHTSSEGKLLEDPSIECPEDVYQRTISPEKAPDKPTYIEFSILKFYPLKKVPI